MAIWRTSSHARVIGFVYVAPQTLPPNVIVRNATGRKVSKGTILDASNMRCRRKRKSKCATAPNQIQKINGTIIQRLGAWSVRNPFGKNVPLDMSPKKWIPKLLQAAPTANGAHIHTQTS